jgi:hypothetical protein
MVEGRALLLQSAAQLGPDVPQDSNVGVWFGERVFVLRDLSILAAQAGDQADAAKWIAEGTELWHRMPMVHAAKHPAVEEWLAWGKAYMAQLGPSQPQLPRPHATSDN